MSEILSSDSFEGYNVFLQNLKSRIQHTQVRAALAVSHELISLYWSIGQDIVEAQARHQWGDKVLERIAEDLKSAFSGLEGFSRRNLYRMRQFYLAYKDQGAIVPQVVAQIPWGQNAVQRGLLEHLKHFLLELGAGFAFVGEQYHLEVGGEDFYVDLLFYHLKLRAFVVIELKARDFQNGDVGQVLGYVGAVDDLLRHASDAPTIGLILCKGKNRVMAEYVLRGVQAPVGIAEFITSDVLPENLESDLPTIAQLEAELAVLDARAGAKT